MSFVRSDVKQLAARWREAMAGAALSALGAWHAMFGTGIIPFVGLAIAMAGAILLFTGFQRARIRSGKDGPGMVEVIERQVTYFSARDGVSFSLDDVSAINIETTGGPDKEQMTWVFVVRGEGPHHIPGDAVGSEQLFDAVAGFIGANTRNVIRASGAKTTERFPVWKDKTHRLH